MARAGMDEQQVAGTVTPDPKEAGRQPSEDGVYTGGPAYFDEDLGQYVARVSPSVRRIAQAGGLAELCHPYGAEPQELLAHGPHAGIAERYDQRMDGITELGLGAKLVDHFSLPGRESARATRPYGETF